MIGKIGAFFATIILSIIIFFIGMDTRVVGNPTEGYQVYLNGEVIGLITSKNELLDLIDSEQDAIKKEYNVDKVYPPNGLDIQKVYTYNEELSDVKTIYNKIKDIEPFTIEGYVATITYTEDKILPDEEVIEPSEPLKIYMMDKSFIETALYNTASAFIGTEDLENYENETQKEITEEGSIITSVYFQEKITIKPDYISTSEQIFSSVEELSRYLLFGTLEDQKIYITREGENLDTIANANHLNIEELLIANPQYSSADVLLTAGEEINVGLIAPLVSVEYHKKLIENVAIKYETEIVLDNTKYNSYKEVTTKGQDGILKTTNYITYVNGEIINVNIPLSEREEIVPVINEVVTRGTKVLGGGYQFYEKYEGNGDWSWPTTSPFWITSRFKWRWGKQHQGIDISGPGRGSPVYAVASGVVYDVNYNRNKSEGLSITIDHGNGYYTQYMHLNSILVKEGERVDRKQKIATMGSTGRSTGPHLHLGVWKGRPYEGGTVLDPCASIFSC